MEVNIKRSEIEIFFGMKRLKSYQEFIEDVAASKAPSQRMYARIY